jgi:hypothetical protein
MRGRERGVVRRWWEGGTRLLKVSLGLGFFLFILAFFLSAGMVEPVRFCAVQSISDFRNQNRTEQEFFCDFLIG